MNFEIATRQFSPVQITSTLIILQFIQIYSTFQLDTCQGRESILIIFITAVIDCFLPTTAAWESRIIAFENKAGDLRQAIDVNILSQSLIFKFLGKHIE